VTKSPYTMLPILYALAATVPADNLTQPATSREQFKAPRVIDWGKAPYPLAERSALNEGWAVISVMVDPEGKPYEATVAESMGSAAFEQSALTRILKSRFEPASVNGTPVHGAYSVKLEFTLSPKNFLLAKPAYQKFFVERHVEIAKAAEAGDRESADARLARMQPHTLYEDALFGVTQYYYSSKWGTETQQLRALRRAVAGEKEPTYLSKRTFAKVLETELQLEIQLKDFARALRTAQTLTAMGSEEVTSEPRQESLEEIRKLRDNEDAYTVPGELGERPSWYYELLKRRFQVEVTSGAIAEVKVRCDRQYLSFPFDPTQRYTIPGHNQSCWLELIGQPGTHFRLTQS
jgi:TonB family protein